MYLAHNTLPSHKAARRTQTSAERYLLLGSLLFRLSTTPGKELVVLAIPESCLNRIITLYHPSVFAGHQGVIETYLTINETFLIPNLIHYLKAYIKGCHICQLHGNEKPQLRQL